MALPKGQWSPEEGTLMHCSDAQKDKKLLYPKDMTNKSMSLALSGFSVFKIA
jgi:hypothetical protein